MILKYHRVVGWLSDQRKSNPQKIVLALFVCFTILLYGPFIAKGGLIYDDWSVARLGQACPNFSYSFTCYWPNYSDRPLAAVYYSTITNILNDWAIGYILLALGFWFGAIYFTYRVLLRRLGLGFAAAFLFVAVIPSISSTVIFSPAMQGIGALAYLAWAGSFYLLDIYLAKKRRSLFIWSLLLMQASLFLYESSLPLFALSAAWPFVVRSKQEKIDWAYWRHYFTAYLLPIGGVVAFTLAYQKLFIIHFVSRDISKFRLFDSQLDIADIAGRSLFNTFYVFTLGTINLSVRGLNRVRQFGIFSLTNFLALLATAAGAFWVVRGTKMFKNVRLNGLLLIPVLLGVAAIHFVALNPPSLVGYINRGLLSASIALALMAAILWRKASRTLFATLLWFAFFVAYLASFLVQRNNYIISNVDRSRIEKAIVEQLRVYDDKSVFVLADTPIYTSKNFNNETVFSDEVLDWANFLYLKTDNRYIRGISVSPERVKRQEIVVAEDKLVVMKDTKVPVKEVLFYKVRTKELITVQNGDHLKALIKDAVKKAEGYPVPADGEFRDLLRHWVASY
jgi:hypothetical protein